MEISKRDYIKAHLAPINKQLNKHGGLENKIKLTKLTPEQVDFLHDLMTQHLDGFMDFAGAEILDFHSVDLERFIKNPPYEDWKLPVEIHGITLPEKYEGDCEWELLIGRTWFGATQMVLTMKGWEIADQAIV